VTTPPTEDSNSWVPGQYWPSALSRRSARPRYSQDRRDSPGDVRPPCTRNLGRLFLGPVSGPDSDTHGCGIRDLVWGWHSADLRRWLVILSATPHHHAGPVHRVGRCGCTRLEPINQSGLVRGTRGARLRGGICQKGYSTCEGVRNAVAMSFPGTQRSCRHSPNMSADEGRPVVPSRCRDFSV
jgi:hypothetical protein